MTQEIRIITHTYAIAQAEHDLFEMHCHDLFGKSRRS